jgi:hypothetical protein
LTLDATKVGGSIGAKANKVKCLTTIEMVHARIKVNMHLTPVVIIVHGLFDIDVDTAHFIYHIDKSLKINLDVATDLYIQKIFEQ